MSRPLEGLSSSTRLAVDLAAREGVHGGFPCDNFGGVLSPRACESRAKETLRSGGMRHLCDGAACGHYDPAWEGQITAEIAARPRCACGEPLEGSHVRCPDCEAYHHQAIANRLAARRKRAAAQAQAQTLPDPTPAPPKPREGGPMTTPEPAREPQPEAQHPHRYGDRPLPEGARVSALGAVYINRTQMAPCPRCADGWKMIHNHRCRSCRDRERQNQAGPAPTPAKDAAAIKSLKRLRKQLEAKEQRAKAKPEPAPEPKRPRGTRVPPFLAAPPTPRRAGDQAVTDAVRAARKPAITVLNAEDPATMRGEAPDLINQPPHYIAGDIQCIAVIRALGFDFEEGSALKYLFRHTRKGAPLQDLRKCRFYVDALIARYEEGSR